MEEKDVKQESSPDTEVKDSKTPEEEVTQALEETKEETPKEDRGSKTPPENLIKALDEERNARKEQAEQIKGLQEQLTEITSVSSDSPDEETSEDIVKLKEQINALEDARELDSVISKFPELKEQEAEFAEFRKEYPRHKLENIGKLFLAEKGIINTEPRKGLEKKTGGTAEVQSSGLTPEKVEQLRNTNYSKYKELLLAGKLDNINLE